MKFVLVSPKNRTVYNFRGDLIKEIQSIGYEVIVIGPNSDHMEEIDKLGVRFEEIPLKKTGINIFSDLKYMIRLYRFLKRERPNVILSYTIKPVIYSSIAGKLAKVKSINSLITGVGYAFTAQTFKARIIKVIASILYKIGLSSSDTVIFQNKDDMNEFINKKLVKKNKCFYVNGSGVNMKKFKPIDYPKDITFFMLSRILKSKGVLEYLEAAKLVKEKHPNIQFMLLGALENMQDSLSTKELMPFVDQNIVKYFGETTDVSKYYAMSSVFVLPSYREGTPRTVLEAMSMSRPIITTNTPGCKGTVMEGVNGFLVPAKDSKLLAERMEWFIKNPNKISVMGKASYELCKQKFDVNLVNRQMINYLKL